MPDEVVPTDEDSGETINLLSPQMSEPVNLELTLGEAMLVRQVLDSSMNPRGFQMVEFCYQLMAKFKTAIESKQALDSTGDSDE